MVQASTVRRQAALSSRTRLSSSGGAAVRSRLGERSIDSTPPADGLFGILHNFNTLRIFPDHSARDTETHPDVPYADESGDLDDQPDAGTGTSGPPPAPTAGSAESCAQPRDIQKITSGGFLSGLSMDDYYPDLAATGRYGHPAILGTYDTGTRVGANIQLIGVIPAPCLPGQYSLAQTVTRTRYRKNGTISPEEGMTFDDVGKSGRDVSKPPFRQEFLGGSGAPLGYIISMADPPSTGYGATDTIEHDRNFTTSLVGPGGSKTVTWSLSTRITNGAVTKNDLS
jgi:hypothetical protein